MKAFARHGKINRMLCLPGAIMFALFLLFSLAGCGSSGGGGGGGTYEKLTKHNIETQSPSIVNVTFTVSDQQDQGLSSLNRNDFIISEDGVIVNPGTAELTMYKRDTAGITYSLNTALLIDNSPSQAPYFESVKDAAKALVDFLDDKKQQNIAIITFNADGSPYIAQSMTNNPSLLKSAIDAIATISTPGAGFDLYGGFLLGLDLWDNDTSVTDGVLQQGFLLALTDGHDTAAKHTIAEITAKQNAANSDDSQPKQIITVIVGPDSAPVDLKTINNVPACPDNGYYVVADPTTQDKNNVPSLISTIASNSKTKDSIQQIMLGYADSLYWLKYKTDKVRGSGSHVLVVSVANNPNTDTVATVSGNFSTDLFYTGFYASLTPQYVGAAYPWYVNSTFNVQNMDGTSFKALTVDDIIALEDNAALIPATSELALYTRKTLPDGYSFAIQTVLLIDNSPSQSGNLAAIKAAAKAFIAGIDNDQKIELLAYNADPSDTIPDGTPQIVQPFTDNKTTLNNAVDAVNSTSAATDFYGSLLVGLGSTSDDASPDDADFNQSWVIAVTDGNETFNIAKKQQVTEKLAEVNPKELQAPQVLILGIGPDAATNTGLADIAQTRVVLANGNNGLLLVGDTYAYDHGVYTNMVQQALVSVLSAIKDDADGFYWLKYKTALNSTNAGNHIFAVSLDGNDNTGAGKSFTGNFTTDVLFNGSPGVYLTPASGVIDSGINTLNVPITPGDSDVTVTLSAATLLADSTPYETAYTWSVSNGTSVSLLSSSGNSATFTVNGLGDSAITVEDTKNNVSTDLNISVTVDTTDYYQFIPYNVEPESPWFVNAMFQVGDGGGGWQTGLTRDYFAAWEDIDADGAYDDIDDPVDNQTQDLNVWKHDALPTGYSYTLKTVLLIDNTPSQADFLDISKAAAKKFIAAALGSGSADSVKDNNGNIQQEIAIASFDVNGDFELVQDFSTNTTVLNAAVNGIGTGSGVTYLYGAMIEALGLWDDDYAVSDDNAITQ
ncbi:MAG: VWA domain-containing protein, partial [Deltaproteobacteria bacterium]|nr:VWA domain-containing protein [Deltaproteobacteria bacterium]